MIDDRKRQTDDRGRFICVWFDKFSFYTLLLNYVKNCSNKMKYKEKQDLSLRRQWFQL